MSVTFRYADGRVEDRAVDTDGMGLPETWTLREPVDPWPRLDDPEGAASFKLRTFRRVGVKRQGWRRAFAEYHESPPCMGAVNACGRGHCCPMLREASLRGEGPP